jgi:hypothetical protein
MSARKGLRKVSHQGTTTPKADGEFRYSFRHSLRRQREP